MLLYSALCFLEGADVEGPAGHSSEYVPVSIHNPIYIAQPIDRREGRKNTDFLDIEGNLVANLSDERAIDFVFEGLISKEGSNSAYNVRSVLALYIFPFQQNTDIGEESVVL